MELDVIIREGNVIDGAGNPWFKADIGLRGDKIAFIGNLRRAEAAETINARGLIVSPGFIDMHSHSDFTLLLSPKAESKVTQGVTTEVVGNCGGSAAPMNDLIREHRKRFMRARLGPDFEYDWSTMKEYMDRLDRQGVALNAAPLVGHGTVRSNVIGFDDRKPSEDELQKMCDLVAQAMREGAWGLSRGLIYAPGCYAETEEIIALAKVAAKHGGIYSSHIRGEGETLLQAVQEAIEIGEKAGIPVEISHFKASGKPFWGMTRESLKLVEKGRDKEVDITLDQYPYTASSTGLSALLPHWVHDGGTVRLLERLKDPETRASIKEEMEARPRDWQTVVIVFAEKNRDLEGKTVDEIARLKKKDPYDMVFDLLLEEDATVSIVSFSMGAEDVRRVIKSPYMMVGSDGRAVSPHGILGRGKPHPRFYGTFPRILSHYVREEGVLTLQDAIRRMTSFPAQKLCLRNRGLLREGMKADITIFDPHKVVDEATFTEPHQFASGISYVLVNGEIVVEKGKHTGPLPGRALRKTGQEGAAYPR